MSQTCMARLAALLLLGSAATAAAPVAAAPKRPNILFMMADQLRFDALGATSRGTIRTPGLDALAAQGMRVEYSWSSTPTCTPARAAILTGQSPWHHGLIGAGEVAPVYAFEMPAALAAAGYSTTSFGKDHFGWNASSNTGIQHGYESLQLFDGLGHCVNKSRPCGTRGAQTSPGEHNWNGEFDDYDVWFRAQPGMAGKDPQATLDQSSNPDFDADGWNGWHGRPYVYDEYLHPTAWVARHAVRFVTGAAAREDARPWFLKVSFHRPHSPYDPPQRVLDSVKAEDLPPIIAGGGETEWDARYRDDTPCGEHAADAWCGLMPEENATLSRRAYYASVQFVDEGIANITAALAASGQLEDTWIIFSADHGDGQGDHYHWRKMYPYEFSAHVPMILRWPAHYAAEAGVSIPRGTVIGAGLVTELRDVLHTVLDAAGPTALATIPQGHFTPEDGKSLLCLLRDPSGQKHCAYPGNPGPWRQFLDLEHSQCYNETNHWNALTDGKIKYIFRAWFGDEHLFNLTADPGEQHELSGTEAYRPTLLAWRARMVSQFEREQRGSAYVAGGKLVRRDVRAGSPGNTPYSPNYPKAAHAVLRSEEQLRRLY